MARLGTAAAFAIAVCAVGLCQLTIGRAEDTPKYIPWKIDEKSALSFAAEANGEAFLPSQFRQSTYRKSPPFLVLDLYARNKDGGVVESFAVNPWTGDVWDMLGCYKLLNYELRHAQLKLRKQFTADELTHYDELAAIRPKCVYTDW